MKNSKVSIGLNPKARFITVFILIFGFGSDRIGCLDFIQTQQITYLNNDNNMQTTAIKCTLLSYIYKFDTYRIPPNSGRGALTKHSFNNPLALSEISQNIETLCQIYLNDPGGLSINVCCH